MLMDMLKGHPGISTGAELFQDYDNYLGADDYRKSPAYLESYHHYASRPARKAAAFIFPRKLLIHRYLNDFFSSSQSKARGFKLMHNHLNEFFEIERYIKEKNIAVIHLYRSNLLRTYVSTRIARKTKVWTVPQTHKPVPVKIFVDIKDLRRFIAKVKGNISKFRDRLGGVKYLEITYESLYNEIAEGTSGVLGFLGVEQRDLAPGTGRMNPFPLNVLIENYEEVRAALKDTGYGPYLEEQDR